MDIVINPVSVASRRAKGGVLFLLHSEAITETHRVVASGTWLASCCPGNVLTGLAVPWQRPVNNYEVVLERG
jgi:hypothetical protein